MAPDPAFRPLLGISGYFDSPELSDIIIRIADQPKIFHAHKLVLAQGSPWFRAAFQGGFQEADASYVELHDDDPEAVKGLFAFLYGLYYDGFEDPTPLADVDIAYRILDKGDKQIYQLKLLVAADKYGVQTLVDLITEAFTLNVVNLWFFDRESFTVIARMVYETAPLGCGGKLRSAIVNLVVQHMHEQSHMMQHVTASLPELAVDVVTALTHGISQGKIELRRTNPRAK